ncbi:ATP synthase F1 subunit epsilon [Komagataeibacter rhaeticus]|uniref:ATP synthase epsilon chain n=1 Tax=Komagataeibacter rhaeticus TaxID=215221 RepID=A0A181CDJ5_9PROT|nr:ATP synthase F1 subunit epsilon [Komagataeibacter rhaeticus]ATU71636.1 ATP synthase F1 subunit epsilon [Komagataeibacter xylinus]EGG77750.1 ATP synthase epsilon chain [Gluconacetobacter sp. SXCC-1]KDU97333.1 ATP synthase subunit epsilon [Komagataeibacter rhaeticus AF1]MBL7241209.1 ATP synthase F1 subunit epsilon [Komagataeibacter rhaeticus]PYD53275.1 ATP synthase F1 subunit epsilon [Komagataeibacter rhaeticus]
MSIKVKIVSPEKVMFSHDADMVVMPGTEGDIAAMPDHAPLMLTLRGGVVDVYEGAAVTNRFFVAGGFADMAPTHCTILADRALRVEDLSVDDAEARLEGLEKSYEAADKMNVPALDILMGKIQSARAEIEAAQSAVPISSI